MFSTNNFILAHHRCEAAVEAGHQVSLAAVKDLNDFRQFVFIAHRHVPAGRKIDNGKPPAAQAHVGAIWKSPAPHSGIVRPTMRLHRRHAPERFIISAVDNAIDSAHEIRPY